MSKLLKYHVIGSAVDSQQNAATSEVTTTAAVPQASQPRPSRSEPDIFQLPPLPETQQTSETASSG